MLSVFTKLKSLLETPDVERKTNLMLVFPEHMGCWVYRPAVTFSVITSVSYKLPPLASSHMRGSICVIDWCLQQAGSPTKQPEKEAEAAAYPVGFGGVIY